MPTLTAECITAEFKNRPILRDVFLRIGTGERVGMVGLNGSGKTTLINILFGTYHGLCSAVRIDNNQCRPPDRWKYIGVLPQRSFLPRDMTVSRAACLFAGKRGEGTVLQNSSTKSLIRKKVKQLSSGERRLVEFLLVLSLRKQFILLDEPFSQIEPLFIQLMSEKIRVHPDVGFLITDHDYRDVCSVSTRLVALENGNLSESGMSDADLRRAGYLPS